MKTGEFSIGAFGEFTSGTHTGVTAGIDGALGVVAELRGDEVAQGIQLYMAYAPEPPFQSGTSDTAPPAVLEAARLSASAITARDERRRRGALPTRTASRRAGEKSRSNCLAHTTSQFKKARDADRLVLKQGNDRITPRVNLGDSRDLGQPVMRTLTKQRRRRPRCSHAIINDPGHEFVFGTAAISWIAFQMGRSWRPLSRTTSVSGTGHIGSKGNGMDERGD
jgi:hypothetical protein